MPNPDEGTPERILARLAGLHPRVIDLSLDRIDRLLETLGRPERRLPPVFHIAGTNGKGSVLAYMRAALEAAGHRVHVYTSPHLVAFNERIRLAGALIDDEYLARVLETAEAANAGAEITFFEITTAAAFLAFAEVPADILLLETGLGGRLDTTNVVERPVLTAITTVAMDHQQFLGDDLAGIAAEKAGIIKPGVPVVLAPQQPAAARVIASQAAALGAPVHAYGEAWSVTLEAGRLRYASDLGNRSLSPPVLEGPHQVRNAGMAVACLERLEGPACPEEALNEGLRRVDWPGRLQRLTRGPLVEAAPAGAELWLDGGHNPDAGEAIARTLETWIARDAARRPLYLVLGMLSIKDPTGYLAPFRQLSPTVLSVPVPGDHDSVSPMDCLNIADRVGLEAWAFETPAAALDWVRGQSNDEPTPPPRILIAGSLYLAGAILAENG
ncbi:MAG: folylpolyglutamate synthase/dihydrofolate synthase family protein [Alphaproteobacteria bacterium]|nr:folylpolyglutamate synthase/dihydrofolate synthase family protein [Alphaproteobacteria bacterium]